MKNLIAKLILCLLILTTVIGCKGKADSKFSFLESNNGDGKEKIVIKISSFTPEENPIKLPSNTQMTFNVQLVTADASAKYKYMLDDTIILQDKSDSFFELSTGTITPGVHKLTVVAYNATSSDSHDFNLMINTPASIAFFEPNLSGSTISCGLDTKYLTASYSDQNLDQVNIKWYLNNNLVTIGNPNANVNNDISNKIALLNFHPDCTQTGINFIRLDLNDGFETTSQTWTVIVKSPITIAFSDTTPTTDPTVLTNKSSTTFGVTLTTADPTANFLWILDNTITLQNDRRSYFTLKGSDIATGAHTLKVVASNANSSATKTFNVIKNSPPSYTAFTPAFTDTKIDCTNTPMTISASIVDPNNDNLTFTWSLDDNPSAFLVPANNGNQAQALFKPACAISGTRNIKLKINDGYEDTILTWNIVVNTPIDVKIVSFLPTASPVTIVGNQNVTFTVALSNSDPNVNYSFTLKNISTQATQTLQEGTLPFYNLSGSLLAAGNHELKVVASNATSSDTKIFNIKKNTPPSVPPAGFVYSPSLTGTAISCDSATQVFQTSISDADSDPLTVGWTIDGSTTNPGMVNQSTTSLAKITYTPTCSEVGIKTIKVNVSDGYETSSLTWTVQVYNPSVNVQISSASPIADPITVTSTSITAFAVSLVATDPSIIYTWTLDGNATPLQAGTSSVYQLNAASVSQGLHTLKVVASNSISSDQKTFNIKVNSPPSLVSFTPTLTGANLACGLDNLNFNAVFADSDQGDTVQVKWYLNNSLVNVLNSQVSLLNDTANNLAQVNYHPDCNSTGINFIRLDLFDGKETITTTWSVFVSAPVTIKIADFTPTANPVVMTSSSNTTFAVTLKQSDATAKYDFILDSVNSLQTNNSKAYYNLVGASLTPGDHTLKVKAYNTSSTDEKVFNIRKNSPPTYTAFSPAFTGTTVNCGASPITLSADMLDVNGDNLTFSWVMDDNPSSYLSAQNSGSKAQASFNPSCAITGTRVIKAIVSDGYESVSLTWSVTVAAPINIKISSFLPATNPTIIIGDQTTTFAVALVNSDTNVIYDFLLKKLSDSTTTTLQSSTVPFYNLSGSSIAAGNYELKVIASNGTSSDSKTFSIRKNSPPSLPPTGLTYSPALTGIILNCGSSSQVFQSAVGDLDNDILAINWFVDNVNSPDNLVSTSSQSLAKATYTPTCAEVGIKTIRVDVFDGYEKSSMTWTVQIINPTVVSINAYSPNTDPVNILSTGSQIFNVSATGKAPLSYEWKLDGQLLSSFTSNYATLNASSLTVGAHTLVVKVSDSDSNQSKTFNIIRNAPPQLTNTLPVNLSPKININTLINFSTNFSDANNDPMTVTWKLNNVNVTPGNPNAAVTSTASTTTMVFTPSAARIGDNEIKLEISDGKETTSQTWKVNVNYFSDVCNNLGAGKVCTLIGRPGRGSNVVPANDPTAVMLRPHFISSFDSSGSMFISDNLFHVVWFYNKSASTVNILGQSIGPGVLKAVVGVGQCGTGVSGSPWNDFPLCNPRGIAWDNDNQRLFISDESNSRVYMVNSTGTVYTVVQNNIGNNATGNKDNANALTSTWCANPRDLAYDSSRKLLYIACYGSYSVKALDTSDATYTNWTTKILSGAAPGGVIAAWSNDGTNGYAGTNQFYYPTGLKLDTQNDILYVTDPGHCKIKAINLSATARTNYYFNAITLPGNSTVTILGNGVAGSACNSYIEGAYTAMRMSNGWNFIELKMNGSNLDGIFLSEWNNNLLAFINNTASAITLGNRSVPAYSMYRIWNTSGGSGYYMPCSGGAASTTCYMRNPGGMYINNNKLYVADYSNFRVRSLDISVANGAVADELGFDQKANYAGNGGTSSENVQFNMPLNLYFDQGSGKLIVSDFYNYRFRALNLNTGRVDSFIGNGNGAANNSNIDPTVVGLTGPRGIVNYQNFYIYADNQNQNCLLRAWNTLTTTQTILGITTYANAIQTVVGNWANGCGAWNASATTGTSTLARLNQPNGVATDGTNLYFANTNAHCIVKVDSSGNMSTLSGLCGTQGAANGTGMAYNNTAIRYFYPTSVVVDPRAPYNTAGNLFILDQTPNATYSTIKIRYLNQYSSAVTVYGVTINPGEIKTIYTGPDNHGEGLAAYDNQVCYSTGGDFNYYTNGNTTNTNNNVICINRDDSTGTQFVRFGRNPSVFIARGYIQENTEEEGVAANTMSLAGPAGLAFDNDGNLYIAERDSHVIRMVKKWW